MAGLHQEKIDWIDGQITGAEVWLDNHGPGTKRPWPEHDIDSKRHRVVMLREIRKLIVDLQAERARG